MCAGEGDSILRRSQALGAAAAVTDDSPSLPPAHKRSAENEDAETTLSPAEASSDRKLRSGGIAGWLGVSKRLGPEEDDPHFLKAKCSVLISRNEQPVTWVNLLDLG
ncbi:hypothetical protein JOQ06_012582, partial [Pogonophryne albipinna]